MLEKQTRVRELTIFPEQTVRGENGEPVTIPRRVECAYEAIIVEDGRVMATGVPHRIVAPAPEGDEAALDEEYPIEPGTDARRRKLRDILADIGIGRLDAPGQQPEMGDAPIGTPAPRDGR